MLFTGCLGIEASPLQFEFYTNTWEPGKCLWSEGVSSPLVPRAVWKLNLYPNGDFEQRKGNVAVFLNLKGPMVSIETHRDAD